MSGERPRLIHLTTVDLSLRVLLSHQLRRFAEEGFDVAGASAPGPYVAGLEADGIRHLAVPSLTRSWTPARDAAALTQLVRLFRGERPDIVHTHNPKSGVLGRVAARTARVPIVVNTVHGLYSSGSLTPAKRRMVAVAERGAARFSHHELFQSREDYELALRTGMVPSSRATWLGNGVDLRRFDPATVDRATVAGLRQAWGAGPDSVVVGAVGRLVEEKGYAELFAAVARLRDRLPEMVTVVVGPPEPSKSDRLSQETMAKAEEAGVVFHGEGTDMPPVYAAFDLFALASHREGMPRSAIEAQAMERAVVATDIRGCREVVAHGDTGLLVPSRNPVALAAAIDLLASDRHLAVRMGEAGRRRAVELFDEEDVVRRTLDVYRRLLAERGIRGGSSR